MIKSLEIFNYKSFLHEKILFGNQLNLIVGRNGHGKSNIYGAMKFLFSIHDYDKIKPEEKRGILNDKLIQNEVWVEAVIKNDKKNQVLNSDEFCLKKEINKNDKIIYYLNGSIINKDLYRNILLCSKIASFSQLKFLSAKNINKIGNMTGEEIYQLVKSLTGATIYEENKESSLHILEKTDEEQNKVKELLIGLEEKIEFLKEKKSKFQVYEKENEKIDQIKKLLFERELHNGKLEIQNLQQYYEQWREKYDSLMESNFQIEKEKEKIENQQKSQINKNYEQKDFQGIKEQKMVRQMKELNKEEINFRDNISKEISNMESVKNIQKEIQNIEKLNCNLIQQKEHLMLMVQKNQNKDNQQTNKENLRNQIQFQNKKIEKQIEEVKLIQNDIKQLEGKIQNIQQQINENYQKIKELNNKLKQNLENNKKSSENNFKIQNEIKFIQQKIDKKLNTLSRMNSKNIIGLISLLNHYKKNNQKFANLLIDCITFPENLTIALEQVFFKQLFTIIVEKEEQMEELIKLNKKLKLGKIRIFPLEWLKQNNKLNVSNISHLSTSFNNQKLIVIKEFISSREIYSDQKILIENLITKIFDKTILVENSEIANQIAKEEELTAVTNEGEVFYPGSFMAKIGQFQVTNSKVLIYKEIQKFQQEIEFQQNQQKNNSNKENDDKNQNQISSIENQIIKSSNKIKQLETEHKMIKAQYKTRQTHVMMETEKLYEEQNQLVKFQEQLNFSTKKNKISHQKNIPEKIQKLNQELIQNKIVLEQLNKEIEYLLDIKESNKNKLSQNINYSQLATLENEMSFPINKQQSQKEQKSNKLLEKKLYDIEMKQKNFEKEKQKLEQEKIQIQTKLENLLIKEQNLIHKIENIQTNESNKQQKEQTEQQLVLKLKNLISKTSSMFTEKDKVVFQKLNEIIDKSNNYNEQITQIGKNKKIIENCFTKIDNEVSKITGNFFQLFKEKFENLYSNFENYYDVEANMIHLEDQPITQQYRIDFEFNPNKKKSKKRKSIEEKSIFQPKQIHRGNLSPGKKVIFGLCLVLALNEIENGHFIIMDEIDSALDQENFKSFLMILQTLSEEMQIFFTSFNQEVTNLQNQNLYFVEHQENSQVQIVEPEFANNFLNQYKNNNK